MGAGIRVVVDNKDGSMLVFEWMLLSSFSHKVWLNSWDIENENGDGNDDGDNKNDESSFPVVTWLRVIKFKKRLMEFPVIAWLRRRW